MFNSSDLSKEKENMLLNFWATEDWASLFEDQDSDKESFLSPIPKKKTLQMESKKELI